MGNRTRVPRLLTWRRTIIGGEKLTDDYLGKDPEFPRMFARVYLSANAPQGRGWCWTVAEAKQIASGREVDVKTAADAAEAAWAEWKAAAKEK